MGMVRSLYSVSALSVELGKDRRTAAKALSTVPPDGNVGAHPAWFLITALAALGWIGRKVDGERLDAEQERARKDKAIADLHEMKLAILRKEYGKIASMSRVMTTCFSHARTKFLAF